VLAYLLINPRISISVSIIISLIVFGLIRYYDPFLTHRNEIQHEKSTIENNHQDELQTGLKIKNWQPSSVLFVTIFATLLIISSITYEQKFHVFRNWNEIGVWGIIQLASAIMLCFFIPGYAFVDILSKKYIINRILAILLSYFLSILITALTAYILSLVFDNALSESKHLFIALYAAILAFYLFYCLRGRILKPIRLQTINPFSYHFLSSTIIQYVETRSSELLVFGSLFMLIIISTYGVYGGVTIGDQWYHQGRSLLFLAGSIKEAVISHGEEYYPPFQSALVAGLTALSGIPLVNSYASIAFLDSILIVAFYYFFTAWIPATTRKAALLACCLFTLSSGFGWIYLLNATTNHPIVSPHSSLDMMTSIRGLDVVDPSNYVIPTAPDFITALIYIALPAGLVLLGLVRTCIDTKFNILIVTAISVLGIISHYEFYLFIIIASLVPIIFNMKAKNSLYLSFLIALSIVYIINVIAPGEFYTSEYIFGIPLLFLVAMFVTITWTIYLTSGYMQKFFSTISNNIATRRKSHYRDTRFGFVTSMVIIFLVAYLYLLSFIVLGQQSANTMMNQTSFGTVPWYIYPIKLGVAGLLGLAFILSYLFKKFEKQVFIFGIIIIVSLFAGPYYNESRFSKYIMIGIVGFASLLIYKILNTGISNKPLRNILIIGIIIPTSGMSVLLFIGYNSLILETNDYTDNLPRRHFPSDSELHLLELLHNKVNIDSNRYNVIGFSNQYDRWKDGFMAKIPSFSGLPYDKLRQSPLALNATTLDALYHHLAYSDAGYIVVLKNSIKAGAMVSEPTRFALEYFKRIYEDDNYVLLEIPPLIPPSSSSTVQVGLIYNESGDIPLRMGSISKQPPEISDKTKYYNYYYPLSILALSKSSYDVFSESDASVFSKHVIVVPGSLRYDNVTLQSYLDYVRKGGTLILIHSQNNFSTILNQLLSLKSSSGAEEGFTSIAGGNSQKMLVNASGLVHRLNMTSLPNTEILAWYRNSKNETIAPFIIEKNFTNGGKIILLNSRGYFDSITKSPTRYFFTLSNITKLLPVDLGRGEVPQNNSIPAIGFIGRMETNGKVSLSSPSLTLFDEGNIVKSINTSRIAIFNRTHTTTVLNNVSIRDLKILGDYMVSIDASGPLEIPGKRTIRDYVGLTLPPGFNMTLKASPKNLAHIEIVTQNQSSLKSFIINNYSRVEFYGIKPESPAKSVALLLKRPELKVDGHIIIKNADFDGFLNERGRINSGVPLDLQGHLEAKFELVDKFYRHYSNGTRPSYLSYLKTLAMNGTFNEDKDRINLPGDIYFKAKEAGDDVQLKNVLTSSTNIFALIILIPIVIIAGRFIWIRKKSL